MRGYLLTFTPPEILSKYQVVGIEQTMNGMMKPEINSLKIPIIGVASSACKRYLESKLIGRCYYRQVRKSISNY